ncbi:MULTISPECIES: acyl-CoA thioester hydrolase YciA [unclassified Neisseria]|uniref:acyl-CoA thioester hydrolase YciA n=1 Tax=unclassified Neisseria TaxID=2623750 RepID=UPI0026652A73|nr:MULTISPECIES: acyl-CoA thioester hydrolase YciA [unclassified Neisseria]MDO1510711.1 acyl-CoA thioester hydrolase YciA [Neisseria sp. MVDL19-042950]MDO1517001.1 acyl-CoA thioester hydrolase YciA [Neisseria sp. MVDL18-041461]MDO1564363.1 acyl-CoA thioester hydrolase YciA [Neisseria sp. MVDL20-010259]
MNHPKTNTSLLHDAPRGSLLLRNLAMPADTNPNGDIFGGWIMSQMDIGGGIMAAEIAQGRIVTVAVEQMAFIRPVSVGDVVCCYGRCVRIGNTSLQIKIEVWVKKAMHDEQDNDRQLVTEAVFTYVAIDTQGRPRPVPKENNPELEQALAY